MLVKWYQDTQNDFLCIFSSIVWQLHYCIISFLGIFFYNFFKTNHNETKFICTVMTNFVEKFKNTANSIIHKNSNTNIFSNKTLSFLSANLDLFLYSYITLKLKYNNLTSTNLPAASITLLQSLKKLFCQFVSLCENWFSVVHFTLHFTQTQLLFTLTTLQSYHTILFFSFFSFMASCSRSHESASIYLITHKVVQFSSSTYFVYHPNLKNLSPKSLSV